MGFVENEWKKRTPTKKKMWTKNNTQDEWNLLFRLREYADWSTSNCKEETHQGNWFCEEKTISNLLCDADESNGTQAFPTTMCCSGRFLFARHEKTLRSQVMNVTIETDRRCTVRCRCRSRRVTRMQSNVKWHKCRSLFFFSLLVRMCHRDYFIMFMLCYVNHYMCDRFREKGKKAELDGNVSDLVAILGQKFCVHLFTISIDWVRMVRENVPCEFYSAHETARKANTQSSKHT